MKKTHKWNGQNWDKVTNADVEHIARRFSSVAAKNALEVAALYKKPVFYSLHVGAFVVTEKADGIAIFGKRTPAQKAIMAAAARRRWQNNRQDQRKALRAARIVKLKAPPPGAPGAQKEPTRPTSHAGGDAKDQSGGRG
jgi:hypothetical protein